MKTFRNMVCVIGLIGMTSLNSRASDTQICEVVKVGFPPSDTLIEVIGKVDKDNLLHTIRGLEEELVGVVVEDRIQRTAESLPVGRVSASGEIFSFRAAELANGQIVGQVFSNNDIYYKTAYGWTKYGYVLGCDLKKSDALIRAGAAAFFALDYGIVKSLGLNALPCKRGCQEEAVSNMISSAWSNCVRERGFNYAFEQIPLRRCSARTGSEGHFYRCTGSFYCSDHFRVGPHGI